MSSYGLSLDQSIPVISSFFALFLKGGAVEPIPEGTLRIPGLEGVGTILRLGTNPEVAKRFSEGQRVAFFPAMGSWTECAVVRNNSLLPVPDEISDQIAAQMLINTITASVLL